MMEQGDRRGQGTRPVRAPRRITPDYLQRAAMHYLERYSAPSAQLRRVLARKIALSCRHHGDDPAAHAQALDEVVARCLSSGLVDDQRFAEARAATLRRRGRSARAVAATLTAKGVGRDLARQASSVGEEEELTAARKPRGASGSARGRAATGRRAARRISQRWRAPAFRSRSPAP